MAKATSHSASSQSTISQDLEARWERNRQRVEALRALADDLERHPRGNDTDADCIVTVVDVLLHGTEAELSRDDLRYLAAIGVPPELVRGDTRHGRADA